MKTVLVNNKVLVVGFITYVSEIEYRPYVYDYNINNDYTETKNIKGCLVKFIVGSINREPLTVSVYPDQLSKEVLQDVCKHMKVGMILEEVEEVYKTHLLPILIAMLEIKRNYILKLIKEVEEITKL